MTIAGWTALERYVRDLFIAPLTFPREGKFVGVFSASSPIFICFISGEKQNVADPQRFFSRNPKFPGFPEKSRENFGIFLALWGISSATSAQGDL